MLRVKSRYVMLNSFFVVGSFFDAESYVHDYINDVARTLGQEGAGTWFTFKVHALLDTEYLG